MRDLSLTLLLFALLGSIGRVRANEPAGESRSVATLVRQLQSGTLPQKRQAAEALGSMGPKAAKAVPALIDSLADWRTRKAASEALVSLNETAFEPVFWATLDSQRRVEGYPILGRMERKPIQFLIRMLKHPNPAAAMLAVRCIGPEARQAVPALLEVVNRRRVQVQIKESYLGPDVVFEDDEHGLRMNAAYALASISDTGLRAILTALDSRNAKPALTLRSQVALVWHAMQILPHRMNIDSHFAKAWVNHQMETIKVEFVDPGRSTRRLVLTTLQERDVPTWSVPSLIKALGDTDPYVSVLAARALGSAQPSYDVITALLASIEDRRVPQHHVEPRQRPVFFEATQALVSLGPVAKKQLLVKGMPTLLRALRDKDVNVRKGATDGVSLLGAPAREAIPALVELLSTEQDEFACHGLQLALASMGKEIQPCMDSLLDHPNIEVRKHALAVMSLLRRQALPSLAKIIKALDEPAVELRLEALNALQELKGDAKPAMSRLIEHCKGKNATETCATIKAIAATGEFSPAMLDACISLLGHKDLTVLTEALAWLRSWGERARPSKFQVLRLVNHQQEVVQKAAMEAACLIDPAQIETSIGTQLLQDVKHSQITWLLGNPYSRRVARGVLDELKARADQDAFIDAALKCLILLEQEASDYFPLLRELLGKEKHAADAAYAAGELGPRAAELAPDLLEALHHPDSIARTTILKALGKIGPAHPAVVPGLIRALDFPDFADRERAAQALAVIGPKAGQAVERLRKSITTDIPAVRIQAAHALARITGEAEPGTSVLREVMVDPSMEHHSRAWAVELLGKIGPKARSAVPELRALLRSHQERALRSDAALALAAIGPAARVAEPDLIPLLHDRDNAIRRAAAAALGELGSGRALPALAAALDEEREHDIAREMEMARSKVHGRTKYR